jgi:hypothetical protein
MIESKLESIIISSIPRKGDFKKVENIGRESKLKPYFSKKVW